MCFLWGTFAYALSLLQAKVPKLTSVDNLLTHVNEIYTFSVCNFPFLRNWICPNKKFNQSVLKVDY